MIKIAVLITCYNRKDKTLKCIEGLSNIQKEDDVILEVFIVDGGSSDGTPEEVSRLYPEINIDVSEGLYWAGGMRKAWTNAISTNNYDYFWLLNDDTNIYADCLKRLLLADEYSVSIYGRHGLYTGCTKSPSTGIVTYGAKNLIDKSRLKGKLVSPSETEYQDCDLCNGNILFVPKEIYEECGILNEKYTHGVADWDYSLRVKQKGYPVLVLPGYLGECERDHGKGYLPQSSSIKERIKYLYSPKGLAYNDFMYFTKEFFPKDYYPQKIRFWIKTLFPVIYDLIKK